MMNVNPSYQLKLVLIRRLIKITAVFPLMTGKIVVGMEKKMKQHVMPLDVVTNLLINMEYLTATMGQIVLKVNIVSLLKQLLTQFQ